MKQHAHSVPEPTPPVPPAGIPPQPIPEPPPPEVEDPPSPGGIPAPIQDPGGKPPMVNRRTRARTLPC